jgi:hypothetical protein
MGKGSRRLGWLFAAFGITALTLTGVNAAGASSPAAPGGGHAFRAAAIPSQQMKLPGFAKKMKLSVSAPQPGAKVTDNAVTVEVAAKGYQLSCDWAGKPVVKGKGHYHVLLDKSLVNMYCTPEAKVSLQNVTPGKHTLEVVPALDDHAEVMRNAREIRFEYEPSAPLPAITDAPTAGAPTVRIVSPKPGDVVRGNFDVQVEVTNYHNSCDLYGKPGVADYGHWHLNIDSTSGAMGGMATMLGMSCENVFHASTVGLKHGSTHRLFALLVDNSHAPLNPPVVGTVDVKIG